MFFITLKKRKLDERKIARDRISNKQAAKPKLRQTQLATNTVKISGKKNNVIQCVPISSNNKTSIKNSMPLNLIRPSSNSSSSSGFNKKSKKKKKFSSKTI